MAAPATSSSGTRSSGRQKLKLQRLTSLARNARAGVCADDVAQERALDTAAGEAGATLPVYVEVNMGGNRCGVVPGEPARSSSKSSTPPVPGHSAGSLLSSRRLTASSHRSLEILLARKDSRRDPRQNDRGDVRIHAALYTRPKCLLPNPSTGPFDAA